ncbi:hypothetical protein PNOK_0647800 [Pyrrhoderma noxium]|uniref:Uncharacterized protein n=1 Tax=Pyrrhoderma noxium TaxID=2282107 RepID=A0A286UEE3_9AGAM|nr:hypothetical protein PNOK_0647800 [Pyrrhoderma noxium]
MATMNLKFMQMYHSLEFVESVSSISYISVLLGFLVPLLVAWIIVAQLRTSGSSGFEIPLEFVPYYPDEHHGDEYRGVANFTLYTRYLKSSCYDVSFHLKFENSNPILNKRVKKVAQLTVHIGLFFEAGPEVQTGVWSQVIAAESDCLSLPLTMKRFIRKSPPLDGLVTLSISDPRISLRSAYLQFQPRNALITWRNLAAYLNQIIS